MAMQHGVRRAGPWRMDGERRGEEEGRERKEEGGGGDRGEGKARKEQAVRGNGMKDMEGQEALSGEGKEGSHTEAVDNGLATPPTHLQ